MMYEYPLMEGDAESFLGDAEFHNSALMGNVSDYASDNDYSDWVLVPPKKHTRSVQCQTACAAACSVGPHAAPVNIVRPEPGATDARRFEPNRAMEWQGMTLTVRAPATAQPSDHHPY